MFGHGDVEMLKCKQHLNRSGQSALWLSGEPSDVILIWGDVVHWPVVQFALPDAAMSYDVDPVQATATHKVILGREADTGLLVARCASISPAPPGRAETAMRLQWRLFRRGIPPSKRMTQMARQTGNLPR